MKFLQLRHWMLILVALARTVEAAITMPGIFTNFAIWWDWNIKEWCINYHGGRSDTPLTSCTRGKSVWFQNWCILQVSSSVAMHFGRFTTSPKSSICQRTKKTPLTCRCISVHHLVSKYRHRQWHCYTVYTDQSPRMSQHSLSGLWYCRDLY
jgi:hypothetical protein